MLWKYAATVSPNQSKGAFDSQLCASSNHQILSRYALLYAYQQHNMVQEYVSICFVWMDHRVTREYKHHNLWEKNVKGSTKQYPQDQCIIFMNIYQLIHQSKTSSKLNVRRVNIPFPLILWICCNSWDVNYRTIYWGKSLKITIYLHQVWCPLTIGTIWRGFLTRLLLRTSTPSRPSACVSKAMEGLIWYIYKFVWDIYKFRNWLESFQTKNQVSLG